MVEPKLIDCEVYFESPDGRSIFMIEPKLIDCKLISLSDIISNNRELFSRNDIINIFDVLDPPASTFIIDITLDIYDCDDDDEEYNHGYYQLVQIIKSSSWYSSNDTIFLDISR